MGRGQVGAVPHRRGLYRVPRPRREECRRSSKELQELWLEEAKKYNVLPLDDRRYERVADPTRPGRGAIQEAYYVFYPGTSILHPLAAPQILGNEHTITAHVEIPQTGAEGVLACSGGEFGGWSALSSRMGSSTTSTITLKSMNPRSPRRNPSLPASTREHALHAQREASQAAGLLHRRRDAVGGRQEGRGDEGIKVAGQYSA